MKELTIVIKDGSVSEVYSDTTDPVDINVINLDTAVDNDTEILDLFKYRQYAV